MYGAPLYTTVHSRFSVENASMIIEIRWISGLMDLASLVYTAQETGSWISSYHSSSYFPIPLKVTYHIYSAVIVIQTVGPETPDTAEDATAGAKAPKNPKFPPQTPLLTTLRRRSSPNLDGTAGPAGQYLSLSLENPRHMLFILTYW